VQQGLSLEANNAQLVKKFVAFYGTQKCITDEPATGTYPKSDKPNPYPEIISRSTLILSVNSL